MTAVHTAGWPAMGSEAHAVVVGGSVEDTIVARARIDELERRWSRFRPDSELSRLNAAGGRPTRVSTETRRLVEAAIEAWEITGGRFDPTVLASLEGAGYDRPFASGLDRAEGAGPPRPAPGCAGIRIDVRTDVVTLPTDLRLDLGGIAKGHAADLVVDELLARGVAGALVDIGGDLRVGGMGPRGDGWTVGIDPVPGTAVIVGNGGIATSATTKRRWTRAGITQHHVIDPTTGRPAGFAADAVTVFAATATAAEVIATAALLAGPRAVEVLRACGASGIVATPDGRLATTPDLARLASASRGAGVGSAR